MILKLPIIYEFDLAESDMFHAKSCLYVVASKKQMSASVIYSGKDIVEELFVHKSGMLVKVALCLSVKGVRAKQ